MIFDMKLNSNAMNNIKSGSKKFELRVFDDKRSLLNIGDTIIFHNLGDFDDIISVKIIGLLRYPSFKDFFNDIDFKICGVTPTIDENINRLHNYYSVDEELEYGVIGIKFELID